MFAMLFKCFFLCFCRCFRHMFQVFQLSSFVCCKYCIRMFQKWIGCCTWYAVGSERDASVPRAGAQRRWRPSGAGPHVGAQNVGACRRCPSGAGSHVDARNRAENGLQPWTFVQTSGHWQRRQKKICRMVSWLLMKQQVVFSFQFLFDKLSFVRMIPLKKN